jgi:hypothetical protein
MNINQLLAAGIPAEFNEVGNFFRVMAATGETLKIEFYRMGSKLGDAENVGAGYAERFEENFDKVVITSTAAQTVRAVSRLGNDVRYDTPPVGNVAVTNAPALNGAFVNAQKTVTNASAEMLAANAARRYLLIQNRDGTGDIYVTLDGSAATTGNGIKIEAAGSLELQGYVPIGAINAIGTIANNPNVLTVEG